MGDLPLEQNHKIEKKKHFLGALEPQTKIKFQQKKKNPQKNLLQNQSIKLI